MKKITHLKSLAFFMALFCALNFGFGQSIFDNPITGSNPGQISPYTTGQTVDSNITASGISRGSGIQGRNGNDRYNTINWDSSSLDANDYIEFTLTPNTAYEINFVSFVYTAQDSPTGPTNFAFRSSLDGYTANIGTPIVSLSDVTIDLSGIPYQNISSTITFRFYGWGASSPLGVFAIRDFTFNGVVSSPSCPTTTTWDGTSWDNGAPSSSVMAIIDGSYNTTTNGSFSACSLTVNSSGTLPEYNLTISDGYYVEIENDVVVNGQLYVDPRGNFIQNNDSAIFTDNSTNGVLVTKTKTMQNEYSYTYWSSPVVGETIEQVFGLTLPYRRYTFNAANFVDMLEEVGNTGTFLNNPGVDDIDDNGDDWEITSTGTMQPGVGYAMTPSEFGPAFPRPENTTFRGAFNNGVIQVPLVSNSGGLYYDWNFIGNPYPSAINANQFFAVNTGLVELIYLWDQATPPSNSSGGSQGYNFSNDDYAMINGSGGIGARGNSGSIPNGSIASGQGFFVDALSSGNVTFNNSMRSVGTIDNSQFFKSSNTKNNSNSVENKLWVNLTSDNGVFNQILVSYISGATNNNDGSYYDAKRLTSNGNAAILYTTIDTDNGKFAIQGKSLNSLDIDESIKLGIKTTIDVSTLYSLSIQQLQGDFLTENTVYLKDNLLNKLHNLSASDYTFTTEVGEFNNRFEIVFNSEALSTDTVVLNNKQLSIVELDDNQVQFNVSNPFKIKSVEVFDLLGRQLYSFKGQNSTETYRFSNLSSTVYIAKVTLSNGIIITKKAVKK
jgi:hypothetical protein